MTEIRKHFVFHGRVQGVGFRYTATYLARSLELTGWVRNEYDGTVSAEVQGREEQIDLFIQKLQTGKGHFISIEHIDEKEISLERESSFSIR
ncbi:acylphosphatase [Hespellia stercorisuis]|uniref:acylphosphatase n=1 Tax=Hespellia stercorisuis DSM 15480 TaxID=1121950 RepID=A0A1M6PAQ1_9FIRM|nr:acylphosphatase [Hespellia stercorisuis]SHK05008.1 acylphosphatase [Hespellia stercorisuis DSM 15480]